jgi:hypothetical protein
MGDTSLPKFLFNKDSITFEKYCCEKYYCMLSSFRLKFMIYHLSSLDFNIDIELIDFGSNFVSSCLFSPASSLA